MAEPRPAHDPSDHEIETYSGLYLDLANPDPAAIRRVDIAHGLANTCRYAGQTRHFYSVAEHAVLVARKLQADQHPPEIVLAGLHHDDTEAYIADIARPLKSMLSGYAAIEARVWAAVAEALGLGWLPIKHFAVKAADDWALALEAYHLMPSRGRGWWSWGLYDPAVTDLDFNGFGFGLESADAEAEWLRLDDHLRRSSRAPDPLIDETLDRRPLGRGRLGMPDPPEEIWEGTPE